MSSEAVRCTLVLAAAGVALCHASCSGRCPAQDAVTELEEDILDILDAVPEADADDVDDASEDGEDITSTCDDADPCTEDRIDPDTGECVHLGLDADEDGYRAMFAPDGTYCDATDCDDARDDVHPGAVEVCGDGLDQDCDGSDGELGLLGPGIMLSADDIRVSRNPAIDWSGSEFGVAWYDDRPEGRGAWFTRLDGDGTPTWELTGIPDPLIASSGPDIVSTDGGWAVAWDSTLDDEPNAQIAILDHSGAVVSGPTHLTGSGDWSRRPCLAWSGSGIGVAWVDTTSAGSVWFTLLGPGGERTGADVEVAASGATHLSPPAVVWAGDGWVVAWLYEAVYPYPYVLKTRRLDAGGVPEADEVVMDDARSSTFFSYFAPLEMAWTGSEIGIAWLDRSDVRIVRTTPAGEPVGTWVQSADLADEESLSLGLSWTGSGFMTAWSGFESGGTAVHARFVAADGGTMSQAIRISDEARELEHPAIAWSGSVLGVVWTARTEMTAMEVLFASVGWCP